MDGVSGRRNGKKGFRFARGALILVLLLAPFGQRCFAGAGPKGDGGECGAEFGEDCPQGPFRYVEVKSITFTEGEESKRTWQVKAFQDKQRRPGPAEIRFCADSCRQRFRAVTQSDKTRYVFRSVRELSLVPLPIDRRPSNAVIFLAEQTGGSGGLRYLTLWAYRPEAKKFVNILPKILFTEQGEYKLFPSGMGNEPVLVVADYIWGEETHFARHRYEIRIYKPDARDKTTFALYREYETKSKYASLDETDRIDVITPELKNVKKLLE